MTSPGAAPPYARGSWRINTPASSPRGKEEGQLRHVLCRLPEGPSRTEPRLLTRASCLAKQPVWPFLPIPENPGPASQINYWHSNLHLRVCFRESPAKTGTNLLDESAPLKSPPEAPPKDPCFHLIVFPQTTSEPEKVAHLLRYVAFPSKIRALQGTQKRRMDVGQECNRHRAVWEKASVSSTSLGTCLQNPGSQ